MANPNCGACGHINTRGFCNLTACIFPCHTGMGGYINKPQTNADRIRAMTDEELAFLIGNGCPPASVKPCRMYLSVDGDTNCTDCWLDWLKSPVEVDT